MNNLYLLKNKHNHPMYVFDTMQDLRDFCKKEESYWQDRIIDVIPNTQEVVTSLQHRGIYYYSKQPALV